MDAERTIRAIGLVLSLAVIAGASYLGYWLFERYNPDPWENATGVVTRTVGS